MSQNRTRRSFTAWVTASLGLLLIVGGCISPSDPLAHLEALAESQKRFTEAIRWGDLERAAQYVDPPMRAAFLSRADAFEGIRITNFEIGELDLEPEEKKRAEVAVTYQGYALPYYVERRTRNQQIWLRDEAMGDRWRVQPDLDTLIAGLGAQH